MSKQIKEVSEVKKQNIIEALEAVKQADGNVRQASRDSGIPRETIRSRMSSAEKYGISLTEKVVKEVVESQVLSEAASETDSLLHKIRTLETQVKSYKNNELTDRLIRSKIFEVSEQSATPPNWLLKSKFKTDSTGVPTLLATDWHWAEVIDENQIGGVNKYNLDIAHTRARTLINSTVDLLKNCMNAPKYDGFVFAIGGDMVSGDIHDELAETNEVPLIPSMVDLLDVLIWCIDTLAKEFGNVFVPCVTGNHGRNTHKIRNKDRHHTSFDWLLYVMLERHFKGDERVSFYIPDGPDAYYKIYNHRYLLTHGDQFRGGDGMIGALGPVIRGDHKKRSRNNQVDMSYDTLLIGHFHQLVQMNKLIMNGSLCGYNEYAYANNFGFEPPKQALWITHAERGITFSMPVHAEEAQTVETKKDEWVSIKKMK